MKNFHKSRVVAIIILFVFLVFGSVLPLSARAATTPSLGMGNTFGVLSSTFTRNTGATTITGDLGYTTLGGSGTDTIVSGTDYGSGVPYSQAGIDQGVALTALNTQACTFTFANGPINLSTDTTHGTAGVYTPGVYCTGGSSAASIGTAGIILNGSGTYIFRINGAFTTVDNSNVTLAGGATSCDVFWTPTSATTLGANSTLTGTIIDDSGITIGNNTTLTGRALSFGGTVTTDTDAITSTCSVPAPLLATLTVIKTVYNNNSGTATSSSFNLHVKLAGTDVAGSPDVGVASPGRAYTLAAGSYVVSEDPNASYLSVISGACDPAGNIMLTAGENAFCTITNTDIPVPIVVQSGGSGPLLSAPLISVLKIPTPLALPGGPGNVTYNYTVSNPGIVPLTDVTLVDNKCPIVSFVSGDINGNAQLDTNETWHYSCTSPLSQTTTNSVIATGKGDGLTAIDVANATVVVGVPGLPNTGIVPPLIHILKVPNVFTIPYNGAVTYTYTVTNPGVIPLMNVTVADDKCGPVILRSGDTNNNNLLDPTETWIYTCQTKLTASTTNIAVARGVANNLNAVDEATATVLVSVPGLPKTGYPPEQNSNSLNIIILTSILILTSTSIVIFFKRHA